MAIALPCAIDLDTPNDKIKIIIPYQLGKATKAASMQLARKHLRKSDGLTTSR